MSKACGIPYNTLLKWHLSLRADPEYVPGCNYGKRRNFTLEQEEAVADFLRVNFIEQGIAVRRHHLLDTLFNLWKSIDLEKRSTIQHNFFSYRFLKAFFKRHGLSFRDLREKKRSPLDDEEVNEFVASINSLILRYPAERIYNLDETGWNFVFSGGKVLAKKGGEEVKAHLQQDPKLKFSVLTTISASLAKLPPIFLATGKTCRCHAQFNGMKSTDDYKILHSAGGNTDAGVMTSYLNILSSEWARGDPCALILDRYPSHMTPQVQNCARELNIELVYVPTSGTESYQPCDRYVFGVMKSVAHEIYANEMFNQHVIFTKGEAADIFMKAYAAVNRATLKKAWSIPLTLLSDMQGTFEPNVSSDSDDDDDDQSFTAYTDFSEEESERLDDSSSDSTDNDPDWLC